LFTELPRGRVLGNRASGITLFSETERTKREGRRKKT
jgi:hypothetical protein